MIIIALLMNENIWANIIIDYYTNNFIHHVIITAIIIANQKNNK